MVCNHCLSCVGHDSQTSWNKRHILRLAIKFSVKIYECALEKNNVTQGEKWKYVFWWLHKRNIFNDCIIEETYQEVPPLIVMKLNNDLVFKPNRAANAIASAAAAMWTPASNWLIIFIPLQNNFNWFYRTIFRIDDTTFSGFQCQN